MLLHTVEERSSTHSELYFPPQKQRDLAPVARTLSHLPSLRGTLLGEAAGQFSEGALTRRVARELPLAGAVLGPLLGATLLTDYDPAAAQVDERGRVIGRPMLVPAVGDALRALTVPPSKPIRRSSRRHRRRPRSSRARPPQRPRLQASRPSRCR